MFRLTTAAGKVDTMPLLDLGNTLADQVRFHTRTGEIPRGAACIQHDPATGHVFWVNIQMSIGYATCLYHEARERTTKPMYTCVSQPGVTHMPVDWKLLADGVRQEQSYTAVIIA